MADNKYGRIFTEQDVRSLLIAADETGKSVDDLLQSGEFTFPEDEPLFVIRAKDQLAPLAVQNYLAAAAANGTEPDFQELVASSLNGIKEWQRDNGDKIKLPD